MENCVAEKITKIYEVKEVEQHATVDDCWVINGKNVYDVTAFLSKHPGGTDIIVREAGTNITSVLRDENTHIHSTNAYNLLNEYKIGEIKLEHESDDSEEVNNNDLIGYKEGLVDWNRGLVFQVHKLGDDYLKWVHSPVNRKLLMFDNKFVEYFSRTKWYVVPIVWVPLFIFAAIISWREISASMKEPHEVDKMFTALITYPFLIAMGLLAWTLFEYILHRYVFHYEPSGKYPLLISIHFIFHGVHHKVPFDCDRLVFPPVPATLFVVIFWCMANVPDLPDGYSNAIFSGGLLGYICYDLIHYYLHHGRPDNSTWTGSYFGTLKSFHAKHHFIDTNSRFGISSQLWDIVFDLSWLKKTR